MPEPAKERVDVTALLKGILNGYPQTSTLREYLQNSDDAKASSQTFILDERIYPSKSLVDPVLKDRQGPALLAINDGTLNEADWEAIQTIHSSSKLLDGSATGKNGLGFRASYHLTESPHIFSGRKLLILDPHHQFTENPGGVSIDVCREKHQYEDQFAPFASVAPGPISPLPGTIFRLPLRTHEQARKSRIKNTPTSAQNIRSLLSAFCAKELEEVVLFLKHIKTVEVKHVKADGREVMMGRVSVERNGGTCRITVERGAGAVSERMWSIHHLPARDEDTSRMMSERLGYDIGDQLRVEKLSSAITLAFPTSGKMVSGGKLFTLLPLPISTGFHVHLNADFALTPDRQSLKNILEVSDTRSRESFLVEWNKMIFDTFTPLAWAQLLEDVTNDAQTSHLGLSYALWPPTSAESSRYWDNITSRTVEQVLRNNLSVFPIVAPSVKAKFVSLQDTSAMLVGPRPAAGVDLELLAELGVDIVQPPTHIFKILKEREHLFSCGIVSPEAVYQHLRDEFSDKTNLQCTCDVRPLVDYLASLRSSSPSVLFIRHVPWFTLSKDGSPVALGFPTQSYIIPSSEEESRLFRQHPRMLSWDCMSDALREEVSLPSNFGRLNVSTLKPSDVVPILRTKIGHYRPGQDNVKPEDHTFLIDFWIWIDDWLHLNAFLEMENMYADLFIFPLVERRLRTFRKRAFVFASETDTVAVEAWAMLDVYPLDEDLGSLSERLSKVISVPGSTGYVPQLLRKCKCERQNLLSQDALRAIQRSLCAGLPPSSPKDKKKFVLPEDGRHKLAKMNVFMIVFTDVPSAFPLPDLDDHIFVDLGDPDTALLISLVDPDHAPIVKKDELLTMAFEKWEQQHEDTKTCIIDWAFTHTTKSTLAILSRLKDLPFVTVERSADRVAPAVGLVSPTAQMCRLYQDERGKILSGEFADSYLPVMRQLGFVHETLDEYIVGERLRYLSSASHASDSKRKQKAIMLIQSCNNAWKPEYEGLIAAMRTKPWMPLKRDAFVSPSECRDVSKGNRDIGDDPLCYDLTLEILPKDIQITSPEFRFALGWSGDVGLSTLMDQFRATVKLPSGTKRGERLIALIEYLGVLYDGDKLDNVFLEEFREIPADVRWVPVSKNGVAIEAKYVLLADDVELKLPFRRVYYFEHTGFLRVVGCSLRPTFSVLVEELSNIDFSSPKGVQAGILILQEIAEHHQDFDASLVIVPVDDGRGIPLGKVYYRDTDSIPISQQVSMTDLTSVHKSISRGLAEALRIPFLTSVILEEANGDSDFNNDDDDEPQMSEDLISRIQGFLREYDVRYAMNEFLANADDAGAKSFSITLDSPPAPAMKGKRVLTPAFEELRGSSALIVRNDAKLSPSDVLGLMKVGTGGKGGRSETHGRHGLGALSFYYFTDVVTVISGETVLFLHPSGEYLPRHQRHRKQRTALQQTLAQTLDRYPDQLKPYDAKHGFSSKRSYDGTLFILPLRSKIAPVPCSQLELHDLLKDSYRQLAQSAFFFTNLKEITAYERTTSADKCLWSFSATRSPSVALQKRPHQTRNNLEIRSKIDSSKKATTEKWLITRLSDIKIPACHDATATGLKLHQSTMDIQLAVAMGSSGNEHSFLFSTLRLHKAMSMPYHLNARFALSSNRQTIVLDPSGSDHQRDPKTAYNLWIIEELVPTLYLSTFEYLTLLKETENPFNDRRWWLLDSEDDISKIAQQAFYEKLRHSDHLLFRDVTSTRLSFKESTLSADEPPYITNILTLIGTPGFVVDDWTKDLAKMASGNVVNGKFVKSSLAGEADIKFIRDLCQTEKLEFKDLVLILEYLQEEPDLIDLPCLLLSTNHIIAIPRTDLAPVYYSTTPSFPNMFKSAQFLSKHHQEKTALRLIEDEHIHVFDLNEERILALIQLELSHMESGEARDKWLSDFWKWYPTLPDSTLPSLSLLESSNLAVVSSAQTYLSLGDCVPTKVVYHSLRHKKRQWLLNVLGKLDVDYIDLTGNVVIDKHVRDRFQDELTNLLFCLALEEKGITNWRSLTSNEAKKLSNWIEKLLPDVKKDDEWMSKDLSLLRKLAIWEAQLNKKTTRLSPLELSVLPQRISLTDISAYQKSDIAVAAWSHHLEKLMVHLDIPDRILDARGVIDVVETFKICAIAVSNAALQPDDRQVVFRMAQVAFQQYQDRLPNLIMVNNHIWREIDALCFVQPADVMREGLPHDIEEAYFEHRGQEHPSILAPPSRLVLCSYQPIAWTQRLPFFTEPTSQDLLMLNRSLGVPTIHEVVAHLRVLATRVALDHPGNRTVLSDLKATYKWLDDHAAEARQSLSEETNTKLFLNVNDPENETWNDQWVSARQMVLGMRFDYEELRSVKAFLKHYGALLTSAGCKTLKAFEINHGSQTGRGTGLDSRHMASRAIFNEMRLSGEDTDIVLVPSVRMSCAEPRIDSEREDEDENDGHGGNEVKDDDKDNGGMAAGECNDDDQGKVACAHLRAHRVFLASMFSYIRDAGQGWKKTGEIPFYGSAFGAKALLDFAYTGDFCPPEPSTHKESTKLMRDLLDLFTIADEWELPDFKDLLESKIISGYHLIENLPNEYQTMFDEAVQYRADGLRDALLEFRNRNEQVLEAMGGR